MKVKCTKISFESKSRITFYRRWGECETHPNYCRSVTYKVRKYWYRTLHERYSKRLIEF
jgi:hypothetical protein